jgi:hypothetical protein
VSLWNIHGITGDVLLCLPRRVVYVVRGHCPRSSFLFSTRDARGWAEEAQQRSRDFSVDPKWILAVAAGPAPRGPGRAERAGLAMVRVQDRTPWTAAAVLGLCRRRSYVQTGDPTGRSPSWTQVTLGGCRPKPRPEIAGTTVLNTTDPQKISVAGYCWRHRSRVIHVTVVCGHNINSDASRMAGLDL